MIDEVGLDSDVRSVIEAKGVRISTKRNIINMMVKDYLDGLGRFLEYKNSIGEIVSKEEVKVIYVKNLDYLNKVGGKEVLYKFVKRDEVLRRLRKVSVDNYRIKYEPYKVKLKDIRIK